MDFFKNNFIGLVAVVIALVACFLPVAAGYKAGTITDTSYFDYFSAATGGGFQINGTNVLNATTLKTTTAGGTLTLTTTNAATSTGIIGCIQTYATSTVTPVHLALGATSAATTTFGAAGIGSVAWAYGACPL